MTMNLVFELTIPGIGSWNGKWSGEGKYYAIVRTGIRSKERVARAKQITGRSFYYRWDDGWAANVHVREIDAREARQCRRKSQGFVGYDWMVNSIWERDKIVSSSDLKAEQAKAESDKTILPAG